MSLRVSQLRTVLALSILLGALLPSILIGGFLLKQISEQDRQAVNQTLRLHANNIAQDIRYQVRQVVLDLQSLAQVNDIIFTPTSAMFGFHSNQLMSEVLQQNSWASAIYIVDTQGQILEGVPLMAEILDLSPHQEAIARLNQRVEAGLEETLIEVYQDANFSLLSEQQSDAVSDYGLLFMQPLLKKNLNALESSQQVGALLVFVPMQSLWNTFSSNLSPLGALALYHSEQQLFKGVIGKEAQRRLTIDVDLAVNNMAGPLLLSLSAPSRSLWSLLVERQFNVVIIVVLIIVIVVVIALVLTRRIVDPIKDLSNVVANYSQGRYDSQVPYLAYEEFNQVGGLLKSMAARVTRHQEQLEHRVAERTQELEQANQTLQQTLAKLNDTQLQLVEKEKMAALGGLVAGMAHELNTPIGVGITAASQLTDNYLQIEQKMQRGGLARADLEQMLSQGVAGTQLIESSLQRSAALVNSFKALAGSDIDPRVQQVNLKTWIEPQIQMLLQPYSERYVQWRVTGHNPSLRFNQRALELVLSSLVENSVQHGFNQHLYLHPHILVEIEALPEQVLIRYQDNGSGVAEEHIGMIFNPFYTTGRSSGNVGLGLNQVYNLVNQHLFGSVESFQVKPQGLGFVICLPRGNAALVN